MCHMYYTYIRIALIIETICNINVWIRLLMLKTLRKSVVSNMEKLFFIYEKMTK